MKVLHIHFPRWLTTINGRFLSSLAHLKLLWTVWNLRGFILASLALQTILIIFAPFRKQSANLSVIISIWLAYLLADYIATQAVGLIPNYGRQQIYHNTTEKVSIPHADLLAFWSPFLLVHLGGPDTITALALEDNELWLRTGLHLCTQVSATGRVFFQSLPTSLLWLPTMLMFVAGILKYTERMLSLYYARLTKFKSSMLKEPDPGPNYAKLMESYDSYLRSNLPAKFYTNPEPDQYRGLFDPEAGDEFPDDYDDPTPGSNGKINCVTYWPTAVLRKMLCKGSVQTDGKGVGRNQYVQTDEKGVGRNQYVQTVKVLREAYEYFEKYKGLYVDMIFSFRDRRESREYFLKRESVEAFNLIETELNFTYEVFFTKMIVIHRRFGTAIRCISCSCEVLSLVIWSFFISKKPLFDDKDIRITYILLGGAIVLDIIAILRVLLSDWKIAQLNKESVVRAFLYDKMLSVRERTWGRYWDKEKCPWGPYLRRVFFRRWSESVLQFNLIAYCVNPWSKWVHILFVILPIQEKFDEMAYVSKKWFADDLRDFIFDEIKYKAEIAEDPADAEDVCRSTGDWVLRSLAGPEFKPFQFYPWTAEVEYDECLLIWHVATELLYQMEEEVPKGAEPEEDYRKYSKTLSDYMMYLLKQQPEMMLSVAGIGEVRFRDTCAEATKFFDRVLPKRRTYKKACERIMQVNTEIDPRDIKGDRSKSVLFDACRLANELKKLRQEQNTTESKKVVGMWELMAKVWVELVSYSATHCRANSHAAQLKRGGELLTLVWLLMVHLGLGTQYRITQGNARSKLIISM